MFYNFTMITTFYYVLLLQDADTHIPIGQRNVSLAGVVRCTATDYDVTNHACDIDRFETADSGGLTRRTI